MSRILKFRAWDKVYEEYTTDKVLLAPDGRVISRYAFDSCDSFLTVNDVVIEFDTGLKDRNGKETYEGDIVEWVNGLGEKHIFEIMWNECRASFQMVEIGQEYPYILQGLSDKMKPYCEVIGNIHENPELLGGEDEASKED